MVDGHSKKLIPDEFQGTPFHQILWAYEAASGEKEEPTHFPCRMDEMTEREARIADVACEAAGTLTFVKDCLQRALNELRCEFTKNPCGTDTWVEGNFGDSGYCKCLPCKFSQRMKEVKRSEEKRRRS